MAIQRITNSLLYGLSTDTKPSNYATNSVWIETDTGNVYIYNGSSWVLLVGSSKTETLTNKTLTTPVIASISNTGILTLPTSTDTIMGRATTDTETNKTLVLASNTVTDTSAATGDLVKHNGTKFVRMGIGTSLQVLRTNSAANNLEYASLNAENTGTATGAANGSSTSFTIAHSLGSTPYCAFVQVSSVLGSNIAFSFTYDSTNITVLFASAPASGTITFQWKALA